MTHEGSKEISWNLPRENAAAKHGTGNWRYFPHEMVDNVLRAAEVWRETLSGIKKPWLCWCVDDSWCWVQQQLVTQAGWTPVVGTDGNVERPRLYGDAIFINFNQVLELPMMWMHFPLEFAHLFAERLAFWHSDVLLPPDEMARAALQFEQLPDGEVIAVKQASVGPRQLVDRLIKRKPLFFKRWWEVMGCTTAGASQSQYEHGTGWWRNPQYHPNRSECIVAAKPYREHGVGVWLWQKHFGGVVHPLCMDVQPYHYSTNHPAYRRQRDRDGKLLGSKQSELARSFDLAAIASGLGLSVDK